MKMLGGYLTEFVNILLVLESTSSTDVVQNFIAMGILADIDNIIGATLKGINIDEECANANIFYKKMGDLYSSSDILIDFKDKKISLLNFTMSMFGLFFYKFIRFVYFVLYFYF